MDDQGHHHRLDQPRIRSPNSADKSITIHSLRGELGAPSTTIDRATTRARRVHPQIRVSATRGRGFGDTNMRGHSNAKSSHAGGSHVRTGNHRPPQACRHHRRRPRRHGSVRRRHRRYPGLRRQPGTPEAGKSKTVVVPEYPLIPRSTAAAFSTAPEKPDQTTLHTIPAPTGTLPKWLEVDGQTTRAPNGPGEMANEEVARWSSKAVVPGRSRMRLTFRRRVAVTATGAAVAANALTAGTAGAWVSVPAHSASGQTVAGTVADHLHQPAGSDDHLHGADIPASKVTTLRRATRTCATCRKTRANRSPGCPQVGNAGGSQSRLGGPPTVRVSNPTRFPPGSTRVVYWSSKGALGPVLHRRSADAATAAKRTPPRSCSGRSTSEVRARSPDCDPESAWFHSEADDMADRRVGVAGIDVVPGVFTMGAVADRDRDPVSATGKTFRIRRICR